MATRGRPRNWENCSEAERAEVENIERAYAVLKQEYAKRIDILKKMLDEVEKKYG